MSDSDLSVHRQLCQMFPHGLERAVDLRRLQFDLRHALGVLAFLGPGVVEFEGEALLGKVGLGRGEELDPLGRRHGPGGVTATERGADSATSATGRGAKTTTAGLRSWLNVVGAVPSRRRARAS